MTSNLPACTTNTEGYHPLIVKAAKIMCRQIAESLGYSFEDYWELNGYGYLLQAKAAFVGTGAVDMLSTLEKITDAADSGTLSANFARQVATPVIARAYD